MMKRIAFIASLGMVLSAGAFAACPAPSAHPKPHTTADNCLDLSTVPQISGSIAASQPIPAPRATAPTYLDDQPYTGPKVGLTKPEPGVKPAPTVGYHWSLD